MTEWFKNDTFWFEMYPHIFSDERLEAADEEVEKALKLIDFRGNSVLDLCCGPGRHSIALAKRGATVTGVDSTPFLLEKAEKKAQEENLEIEWILEDMRNFRRTNAYDLVLNMLTSFGYFEDKRDDLKVLKNIYASLKKGGVCLLDMVGKELIAKDFQPTISHTQPDGSIIIKRLKIFDEWSRLDNEWIYLRDGKADKYNFQQTIYSGQELKDRLIHIGFNSVKLYGNLNGDEYGPDGTRLVAVAAK